MQIWKITLTSPDPTMSKLEVLSWLPMEWQNCAAARCLWMLSLGIGLSSGCCFASNSYGFWWWSKLANLATDMEVLTLPLPSQESQESQDLIPQAVYIPCLFSPNVDPKLGTSWIWGRRDDLEIWNTELTSTGLQLEWHFALCSLHYPDLGSAWPISVPGKSRWIILNGG